MKYAIYIDWNLESDPEAIEDKMPTWVQMIYADGLPYGATRVWYEELVGELDE